MRWALLLPLVLVVGLALADSQDVHVTLTENDVAQQNIALTFSADAPYELVEYTTDQIPSKVIYNGSYNTTQEEGNERITFVTNGSAGTGRLNFTLLYNDAILQNGRYRTFTLHLEPNASELNVGITLPPGFVLADTATAVSPEPDRIESDGRSIVLFWDARDDLDLILLYRAPSSPWPLIAGVVGAILIVGLAITFILRWKNNRDVLLDVLSDDEKRIVELVKKGVVKQKDLCRESGFSKSKMSKVIRKLEIKRVLKKEPLFKTNKIELLPGWK